MIVTAEACIGTIGGGHLEYQAISIANEVLLQGEQDVRIERFPLGARLGQCCGGVAYVSFEFIPARQPEWVTTLQDVREAGESAIMVTGTGCSTHKLIVTKESCHGRLADTGLHPLAAARARALLDDSATLRVSWEHPLIYETFNNDLTHIALFGAGHVGKALVNVLGSLPCRITWIDSRPTEFLQQLPGNVHIEISDEPEHEVDRLPSGSHVVIMTHSHALDQAICERALRRDDLAWCGLIGSLAKRRRFENRLLARGLTEKALAGLTCPIGIKGIHGKHPAEIAIAVAAQMLQSMQRRQNSSLRDYQAA